MFFRKKEHKDTKDQKEQPKKQISAARIPQTFSEAALAFERSKNEDLRSRNSVLLKVAIVAAIFGFIGMNTGAVAIFARKEPEPFLLFVDKATGTSTQMRSIKNAKDQYDEVVNKYWLANYVKTCESYDWFMISSMFEACGLMSGPDREKEYSREVYASNSPLNTLKDKGRIDVKIISITFFGDIASVRFSKQKLSNTGENIDNSPQQIKVATIAYHFKSGVMTDQQRLINPLGFKAISYRSDFEASQ